MSVKGKNNSFNLLKGNIDLLSKYAFETKTYDRFERVYNWLEGIERGLRKQGDDRHTLVTTTLIFFKDIETSFKKQFSYRISKNFGDVSKNDLKKLYEDLVKTNLRWLSRGYFHIECNNFIDSIYREISSIKCVQKKHLHLTLMRENRKNKNNHKFFF